MIQRLMSRARHMPRAFRRATAGAIAIMMVLMIPVLVGMMAVTVDVGIWYSHKRGMQDAVDAAAIAGGNELANGGADAAVTTAAEADADRNGFVEATDVITVNLPPLTGPNAGKDGSVEVIITRSLPLLFTTLFLNRPYTARVRAVVITGFVDEGLCLLGLDETAPKAVSVEGTGTVTLDCGIAVNSSAANAFNVQGSAAVTAASVTTVGGIGIVGGGDLESDAPPTRGDGVEDPYDDLEIPTFSGCDSDDDGGGRKKRTRKKKGFSGGGKRKKGGSTTTVSGEKTFDAGGGIFVFCGTLQINAGADVTFEPGVYIIDQGDLQVSGGASLEGEDVTFILTSSGDDDDIGKIQITGGSDIELSAPTTDPAKCPGCSGVLFYQDRNVSSNPSKSNLIAGGAELELGGALYFPEQDLGFSGGGKLGDGCTQLIGKTVTINGDTGIQTNCNSAGTRPIGRLKATLAE